MGKHTESQGTAPKGAGGGPTPGPWSVKRGNFGVGRYIAGPDGVAIARMASNTTPKTMQRERQGVHEANARLIAAAPDLLTALREARRWIGDGDMGDGLDRAHWTHAYAAVVDQVDAALAKAGGES